MTYLYKKVNCDSLPCSYLYVALLIVKKKKRNQAMDNKSQNKKKKLCFEANLTFSPPKYKSSFFSFLPFKTFMTKYVYRQQNQA